MEAFLQLSKVASWENNFYTYNWTQIGLNFKSIIGHEIAKVITKPRCNFLLAPSWFLLSKIPFSKKIKFEWNESLVEKFINETLTDYIFVRCIWQVDKRTFLLFRKLSSTLLSASASFLYFEAFETNFPSGCKFWCGGLHIVDFLLRDVDLNEVSFCTEKSLDEKWVGKRPKKTVVNFLSFSYFSQVGTVLCKSFRPRQFFPL